MKLLAFVSKNLPNDLLVVTSVIGLVCSALYFIFYQPFYAVLSIASLVFYFLNEFIIFSKFLYLYPAETQVTSAEIIKEKLIIIVSNLTSLIVVFMFLETRYIS
jgi:hypothetical protein